MDPEARREAEKYDNPIPSRELILQLLENRGAPATRAQLQQEFGLPVKLVGLGEGIDDLEAFDPDDFIEGVFEE